MTLALAPAGSLCELRRSVAACFLGAALLLALTASALAEQRVTFPSSTGRSGGSATVISGYLSTPRGKGPFPAVVLLHSCLGLPSNHKAIGTRLAADGYVALFVDDYSTRGLTQTCLVDFPQGVADAYGALAYVASLPDVERSRIAAVGYSQGGDTALRLAVPRLRAGYAQSAGPAFRAVVAYYPPCANLGRARLDLPTLILVGTLDTVTPAAMCKTLSQGQANVTLAVYPGAAHVFDDPAFADGKEMFGMHLEYDKSAAAQAAAALAAFLEAALAP